MRFVKQRHDATCAPIGILNAARFFDLDVTVKRDWQALLDLCRTDKDGTEVCHIDYALRTVLGQNDVKVLKKRKYYISDIEAHLDNGGIVYACDSGHAFLIVGQTKKSFLMINNGKENYLARRSKDGVWMSLTDVWMLG